MPSLEELAAATLAHAEAAHQEATAARMQAEAAREEAALARRELAELRAELAAARAGDDPDAPDAAVPVARMDLTADEKRLLQQIGAKALTVIPG